MKHINKILLVLVIAGVISLVFLRLLRSTEKDTNQTQAANTQNTALNAIYKSFYEAYNAYIFRDEGTKLKAITLKDPDLKTHQLKDVLKKNTLIFRFSANDCDMCFKSVVSAIQKNIKAKALDNVVIIFDEYDDREFMIHAEQLQLPIRMYKIDDSFGLSIEHKNLPFLFMVSENMTVEKLFIPFKEVPTYTEAYLNYVKTLF